MTRRTKTWKCTTVGSTGSLHIPGSPSSTCPCVGRGRDDLLFPGDDGGYLKRPRAGSGWFDKAVTASGVPRTTPHDLRHTAASLAVSAGANVKAVQKMLGHASAAMTLDIYAELFDDDLEAVATALDEARVREIVGKMWARPREPPLTRG
jgi:integrase